MLNRLYHFIALAADATEASEVATTLAETEYAGSTVPAGTTVLFIAGLFLLAAAAIAVTMYLRNHVKNWAYPIYAGAIFYLLFSYIIIQLLSFGASFLPAVKEYAAANGMEAYISLEERMACGVGACLCCVTPTVAHGNQCVCTEGPVFDSRELKDFR